VKLLNDSFAKGFEACLGRLLRKHRSIAACYLRHSAAHESPNPLLSDFDLIFFVSSTNAEELARRRAGIAMDMDRWPVFGRLSKDRIFMPDTPQAYALCRESYPFRSIYPFESWYRIILCVQHWTASVVRWSGRLSGASCWQTAGISMVCRARQRFRR
jgi:hypothetical protein